MPWWEIIGWTGSALVVISLIVPSIRRFRTLNLAGSLIATVYNVVFGIWPYAAMNAVIAIIDAYWLYRLRSGGREYRFVPAEADSPLVRDFLEVHAAGIEEAFPGFSHSDLSTAGAHLMMCADEIAGVFVHVNNGDEGRVLLDYVTDRHRDLTPGRALYSDEGVRRAVPAALRLARSATSDPAYFERMGFIAEGDDLLLSLHA